MIQRQVFYVDDKGAVMTTNTTQGSTWTTPYNILINDYAAKDSIALAVVSDTKSYGQGLGGVRVYYGQRPSMHMHKSKLTFSSVCKSGELHPRSWLRLDLLAHNANMEHGKQIDKERDFTCLIIC
jgi:hypothetical protein